MTQGKLLQICLIGMCLLAAVAIYLSPSGGNEPEVTVRRVWLTSPGYVPDSTMDTGWVSVDSVLFVDSVTFEELRKSGYIYYRIIIK